MSRLLSHALGVPRDHRNERNPVLSQTQGLGERINRVPPPWQLRRGVWEMRPAPHPRLQCHHVRECELPEDKVKPQSSHHPLCMTRCLGGWFRIQGQLLQRAWGSQPCPGRTLLLTQSLSPNTGQVSLSSRVPRCSHVCSYSPGASLGKHSSPCFLL